MWLGTITVHKITLYVPAQPCTREENNGQIYRRLNQPAALPRPVEDTSPPATVVFKIEKNRMPPFKTIYEHISDTCPLFSPLFLLPQFS